MSYNEYTPYQNRQFENLDRTVLELATLDGSYRFAACKCDYLTEAVERHERLAKWNLEQAAGLRPERDRFCNEKEEFGDRLPVANASYRRQRDHIRNDFDDFWAEYRRMRDDEGSGIDEFVRNRRNGSTQSTTPPSSSSALTVYTQPAPRPPSPHFTPPSPPPSPPPFPPPPNFTPITPPPSPPPRPPASPPYRAPRPPRMVTELLPYNNPGRRENVAYDVEFAEIPEFFYDAMEEEFIGPIEDDYDDL